MKRLVLVLAVIGLIVGCSSKEAMHTHKHAKMMKMGKMFQSVPMDQAAILQKGENRLHCSNCGMKLPMFYKTNHAAKVDGKVTQFCSIHCLADVMRKGKKVTDIKVVDTNSLKFIDAKSAFYVVGSSKKGTMSGVSKYAFRTKAEAEKFAKENGGKVMRFSETLEVAKKDFAKPMKMKMMKKE